LLRLLQARKAEIGRGFAHQRARHFTRIQLEAVEQKAGHDDEYTQWQQITRHANPAFASIAAGSVRRTRTRYRRSARARKPPSAMKAQPPQIQVTKGLLYTRTAQRPSPTGSPSDTYRSPNSPL